MIIQNGFVVAIEKNDIEYSSVVQKIQNKPSDPNGYQYRLRADNLEWELVELPEPEPIEDEAGPEDYEQALEEMGVDFND